MTTINGVTLGSGTSQFPPFATGSGANVESPTEWLADVVTQQGFENGVADVTQANTVWRQAMFVASMLAQFAADFSGSASNDDGVIGNLEANYVNALITLMQPYGVYILTDTGAGGANEMIATSTPAPTSYSEVRLVVIKKTAANNTGAMQVNLWGLGAVGLNDNTGTALQGGVIQLNAYYMMTFDGGAFRLLSGVSGTAGAGGVSANSGDAIGVTVPSSTVTLTADTPGTVNWTAHGLSANTQVQFTTTGSLSGSGLTSYIAYYVLSPTTNAFEVSLTPGGTAVTITGAGTGTITCAATGAATVNWRLFLGTHDTNVTSADAWGRSRGSDGTARYMLTPEFTAWIEGLIPRGLTNVQLFTASGTYTPTSGVSKALVFVTGGGGSGSIICGGGSGGGAGATSIYYMPSVSSQTVTIGAGGAAVTGRQLYGNGGGTSSFGSLAVAQGGGGGIESNTAYGLGGLGGTATAGTMLLVGGDGHGGPGTASNNTINGAGGASFWGGGGAGNFDGQTANSGRAYGSGGGGVDDYVGGGQTNVTSGGGASGACLVLEF